MCVEFQAIYLIPGMSLIGPAAPVDCSLRIFSLANAFNRGEYIYSFFNALADVRPSALPSSPSSSLAHISLTDASGAANDCLLRTVNLGKETNKD